jgi:hypothetical protein
MDWHRRLRLVSGFPALYCSHAGSIGRDRAAGFPPVHGGFGVGGGITSGEHDWFGRSAERPVASGSSLGPLVGLTPATGLREPAFGPHLSGPRCPPPSPPEGYFGLDSMILQVGGNQEQRGEASMPREGEGRAWSGQVPSHGSQASFCLPMGPVRLLGGLDRRWVLQVSDFCGTECLARP